jgi:hypothetical protein
MPSPQPQAQSRLAAGGSEGSPSSEPLPPERADARREAPRTAGRPLDSDLRGVTTDAAPIGSAGSIHASSSGSVAAYHWRASTPRVFKSSATSIFHS